MHETVGTWTRSVGGQNKLKGYFERHPKIKELYDQMDRWWERDILSVSPRFGGIGQRSEGALKLRMIFTFLKDCEKTKTKNMSQRLHVVCKA